MKKYHPGDSVVLTYERDDAVKTTTIELIAKYADGPLGAAAGRKASRGRNAAVNSV